ncbi:MAG: hypothetical protein B7Y36_08305 [Novosphingobium sp. 28-62-57]|uniref:hypothetical protein n=1 Tax=unclassified Novosphingobium TaxID=2644732 RepID=UPI000BDD5DF5|nr:MULTISPECIES: hypothetical protein [unclassified Novosphingobium]OYW47925.1 MAG: hypothetical protein B7Z36_01395 [Novosphingobium sp. 12-63-9]OYZ10818.1 MAG: hypothetical protein B7Y36_08305 [Novosphingobium sp. 28-62-57]HQS70008.1 hypothetical protein [Novosphingobium sp.]
MTKPVPTCPHCGSQNIVKDAAARWNPVTCDWELSGVHDYETCEDCEASGNFMTSVDEEA